LLTDTEIRKSKPASEAYRLADGHGLYLWITRLVASSGDGNTALTAKKS
jgi:hypothetical protein